MSDATVVGSATAAQRYMDSILQEVGRVDSLAAVLYYCMQKHPEDIFMINAQTGESFSNASLLSLSVAGGRALVAAPAQRRRACILAANHEYLVAAQLACIFAGVVPLALDPNQTIFELEHFFKLWPPSVIFCDMSCRAAVQQAAESCCPRDVSPLIVTLDKEGYEQFIAGNSESLDDFEVAPPPADGVMTLLPTSGSTGPAKAALVSHRGLVAHLPTMWSYDTKFPTPLSHAGLVSTAQWLTWWCIVAMAPVFRVTVVMTRHVTPQTTLDMYQQYKVEWGLMSPALACKLVGLARREHFTSLRRLLLGGSSIAVSTIAALQDLLQPGAFVRPCFGMTELQGFGFLPDESTPLKSIGRPLNIFQYKIVDEKGQELGSNKKGELWMKSEICLFKGYYQNREATRESLSDDGWLRTGDLFYKDERDNYCFTDRKKFWFKVDNFQVSPEEVEALVGGVRGVELVCVCGLEAGAAALVTCRAQADPPTRADIHHAVSKLNEYKRLNGGIAFVESLPLTQTGKVKRKECQVLLEQLIKENRCFK